MIVRLRLTDYQLAVAEHLKTLAGAEAVSELALKAVEHEQTRSPESRWRLPRPDTPAAACRPDHVRLDRLLPAATAVALSLGSGQCLRVQQLKDGQCADLRIFEPDGRTFSAARTRAEHGINPTAGARLWSTAPEIPLMSIKADTAPGHDLCFPPCSEFEYSHQFGIAGHLGCTELHAEAQARHSPATANPGDDVFNLWLPSAVDADGRLRSWPAACRRGDYIDLQAETDVVLTLSTCPDDLFGSSQYEPGPVRVIVSGGHELHELPAWPSGPPTSALARDEVSISLPPDALNRVDQLAARGWLGCARAPALRALMFRFIESLTRGQTVER